MIVVAVFFVAFVASWAHWTFIGWAVVPGLLSVYVAAYLATLISATILAFRSRESEPIWCAVLLWAYFLAGHFLWGVAASLELRALEHLVFAFVIVALFRTRAALIIAGLFIAMFAADLATVLGYLPGSGARPRGFVVLSHPDVLALIGHGCSIVLGLWSDGGVVSRALRRPAIVLARR